MENYIKLQDRTFAVLSKNKGSISHLWFNKNSYDILEWRVGTYYVNVPTGKYHWYPSVSSINYHYPFTIIYTEEEFEELISKEEEILNSKVKVYMKCDTSIPFTTDGSKQESLPLNLITPITWEKSIKPPLGLIPKEIYEEEVRKDRFIEVCGAISRYYNAGLEINIEWVEEYNQLVKK